MKTFPFFLFDLKLEHLIIVVLSTALITVFLILPYMRSGTRIEPDRSSPDFAGLLIFVALILGAIFIANKFRETEFVLPQKNAKSAAPESTRVQFNEYEIEERRINASPRGKAFSHPTKRQQEERPCRVFCKGFAYQLLATSSSVKAHDLSNRIERHTIVEPEDGLFKVMVVGFETYQEAKEYKRTCGREGFVRLFSYWK